MAQVDSIDKKILRELLDNSRQTLGELSSKVGAAKTPVWQRIRRLRRTGVIKNYTISLDAEQLGLDACFFVLVRTSEHEAEWQMRFLEALQERPEVLEAHRLAGDIDYILKVQVANARAYDAFYQSLISQVKIFNVTAQLSMEVLKSTNELALDNI